jgi:hypothetical protein
MSRRFTYPEAADELRVEESWLRRHIKQLPHSKKGRVVTFSEEDLERIDQICHCLPGRAGIPDLLPPAWCGAARAGHGSGDPTASRLQ